MDILQENVTILTVAKIFLQLWHGDFVPGTPTETLLLDPTGGLPPCIVYPSFGPFEKIMDAPPWPSLETQPQTLAGGGWRAPNFF